MLPVPLPLEPRRTTIERPVDPGHSYRHAGPAGPNPRPLGPTIRACVAATDSYRFGHVRAIEALPRRDRLPQGAEAALWSIVEVIPDPRNHLALTRDPTCEIRLSAAQIEAAAAAPVPVAAASASRPRPIADSNRWARCTT